MILRVLSVVLISAVVAVWAHAAPRYAPGDTAAVTIKRYTGVARAYAQVAPVHTLTLRAPMNGVILGLTLVPGDTVSAGAVLAQIRGPESAAAVDEARAAVAGAQAALALAQRRLAIDEETPHDFVTRLQMSEARAAVRQAGASLHRAQAQLQSIRKSVHVPAPFAATVLSVAVANGERVSAGDPLLVLQLTDGLWLRATIYGKQAGQLRAGLHGMFFPLGGSAGLPVRVQTLIPPLAADNGLQIGCLPLAAHSSWQNGEAGTLSIALTAPRSLPAVPESALVMDQGKWWVLVARKGRLRRQLVAVGPSSNGWTIILSGLQAGERVIARNAYLLFHADIGRHYQPTD